MYCFFQHCNKIPYYTEKTSINFVINQDNYSEVLDVIKICDEFSVSVLGFNLLNNLGRAKNCGLSLKNSELFSTINKINKYRDSFKVNVLPIDVTKKCRFCNLEDELFLNPVVDAWGNVYMCEFLREKSFSIGNILIEKLTDILRSDAFKEKFHI